MADERTSNATRFERVVLPYLDDAYTLARYLTRNATDADDVVQEAVLRALRYVHTLRSESEARAWLLAIVRRECYSQRDARAARDSVPYDEAPPLRLVDVADTPEHATQRQMVAERVRAAINALADHLREALILREVQHCSYEEIAMITAVPIGTVMSRLARARAAVADRLRGVLDVGDLA